MNTETNLNNIDSCIAEIETPEAAKGFIQTIISKFQDEYAIEEPEEVMKSVQPVVRALQGLRRKGFDTWHYADQIVASVAAEFEAYSGEKGTRAYRSTLIVTDQIMHKRGTGFWKKERKF